MSADRRSRPAGGAAFPSGYHTPGASGLRRAIEERSVAPLGFFYRLPRWLLPAGLVILLIAGFALHSWIGSIFVLVVVAFVGWLAFLSWPSLGVQGRVLRVAVMVAFLIIAIGEAFG